VCGFRSGRSARTANSCPACPQLFEILGEHPWSIYRFLLRRARCSRCRTALQALQAGKVEDVLAAADASTEAPFPDDDTRKTLAQVIPYTCAAGTITNITHCSSPRRNGPGLAILPFAPRAWAALARRADALAEDGSRLGWSVARWVTARPMWPAIPTAIVSKSTMKQNGIGQRRRSCHIEDQAARYASHGIGCAPPRPYQPAGNDISETRTFHGTSRSDCGRPK